MFLYYSDFWFLFPVVRVLQKGNSFGEVFDEMKYVKPQILVIKLQVNEPHIEFIPSFQECWELIHRVFMEIIRSAEELPRVQYSLSATSFNKIIAIYCILHNTQQTWI